MKPFLQGKKVIEQMALRAPQQGIRNLSKPSTEQNGNSEVHRSASVDVVKQGDKVVRLIVTCACGEKIEVDCLYPPGV